MSQGTENPAKRESFSSRIGFLLVSAGCAVGIGNVWRFPFVTGQNGGGVFVLFYILFLILLGIPAFTMELAVGRNSKKSAMGAFRQLEPAGTHWHLNGYLSFAGNYLLMMYYTIVAGWMFAYFFKFIKGDFTKGMTQGQVQGVFDSLTGSPEQMVVWLAITVVLGFLCVSFGVQKGLEKISKYMMSALFLLIVVLAIRQGCLLLSEAGLPPRLLPGNLERHRSGHESVVLHTEHWNFLHGNFRQLHG